MEGQSKLTTRTVAQRKATIADVAAHARVDRSVVSRVLSQDPQLNIRDETRERVLGAVAALNYRPNAIARSLRTLRASAYGLIIPDFANPIYAAIIKGAEMAAASRGCLLLTGSLTDGGFGIERYIDLLTQGRVDGLLVAGAETMSAEMTLLNSLNLPWLLLNRRFAQSHRYVILDDERAGWIAVEHLVALGHRRIAHLAGPSYADTGQRRRAGYIAAMAAAGLQWDKAWIAEADYTPTGGAAAMRSLLGLRTRPTAVFVANVASAIGAMSEARRVGLQIPDDLSLVAVHDLSLAEYLAPPLTTIRMPLEDLGRRGVELLATAAATDPIQEVVGEPMQLIVRGSTAPISPRI